MRPEQRKVSRGGRRALALGGALALAFAGSGTAFAAPTNPIAAKEWALNYFNATQVRKLNAYGTGVVVAVIDSGVDPQQPDLQGRLVDGVNLTDPNNPTSDFGDTASDSHGTSVATIIAGHPHTDGSGNTVGVIGLADHAKIMPVKDGGDSSNELSTAAGVDYAVSHGAQVINISEGPSDAGTPVIAAINRALAAGVVVVVSTGNDGKTTNAPNLFATVPGVLDVSGIDSNGQRYSFAHYGSDVVVAAPANDIEAGLTGGQYGEHSGTSLAAPWVSGEAALLIGEHPSWTSGQIVATIIDNTMQVANHQSTAGKKFDQYVGYGVIDPVAALGASEPAKTSNPLGGPAITSNPAQNVKASASAGASTGVGATAPGAGATATSTPAASGKSSSKAPLIIVIVVVVVVLIALLIFLLSRRNRGGRGGPGGGGGGGNGYSSPQMPPGGQYAPPQQQNPYAPQQQPQTGYPPQGGGYGQQNPYRGN